MVYIKLLYFIVGAVALVKREGNENTTKTVPVAASYTTYI